jgi:hypothetical protein
MEVGQAQIGAVAPEEKKKGKMKLLTSTLPRACDRRVNEYRTVGGKKLAGETEVFGENLPPITIMPTINPI